MSSSGGGILLTPASPFARPPDEINGCPEKNNAEPHCGASGLGRNRIDDECCGRNYEEQWRPRISWHAIRARDFRTSSAIDKDAGRAQRVKEPAAENHIGQQL